MNTVMHIHGVLDVKISQPYRLPDVDVWTSDITFTDVDGNKITINIFAPTSTALVPREKTKGET